MKRQILKEFLKLALLHVNNITDKTITLSERLMLVIPYVCEKKKAIGNFSSRESTVQNIFGQFCTKLTEG